MDNMLCWRFHVDAILRKLNSRMYCLRKLKSFNVRKEILSSFYNAVISSVLSYCIVCWGGNIPKQEKARLDKIIKKAGTVIGNTQRQVDLIYHDRLKNKLNHILTDNTHPLFQDLDDKRITRSGRLRPPVTRTKRYANSFIPQAVSLFNANFNRGN